MEDLGSRETGNGGSPREVFFLLPKVLFQEFLLFGALVLKPIFTFGRKRKEDRLEVSPKALRMGKGPSYRGSLVNLCSSPPVLSPQSQLPVCCPPLLEPNSPLVYALNPCCPSAVGIREELSAKSRVSSMGVSETRDWEALPLGMGLALLGFG